MKGHIARDCENPPPNSHDGEPFTQHHEETTEEIPEENCSNPAPEHPTPPVPEPDNIVEDPPTDKPPPDVSMDENNTKVETYDFLRPGAKRTLPSDSDSDNPSKPQRRSRIKPSPNLSSVRTRKAHKDAQDSKLSTDGND